MWGQILQAVSRQVLERRYEMFAHSGGFAREGVRLELVLARKGLSEERQHEIDRREEHSEEDEAGVGRHLVNEKRVVEAVAREKNRKQKENHARLSA